MRLHYTYLNTAPLPCTYSPLLLNDLLNRWMHNIYIQDKWEFEFFWSMQLVHKITQSKVLIPPTHNIICLFYSNRQNTVWWTERTFITSSVYWFLSKCYYECIKVSWFLIRQFKGLLWQMQSQDTQGNIQVEEGLGDCAIK